MELSIRTRNIELTDPLREQIERRLEFAFDTFRDHVQDALVYLVDLNGPKGGVDKLAQITVRVSRIGDLAVRETGTTTSAALNRAVRQAEVPAGRSAPRGRNAFPRVDQNSSGRSLTLTIPRGDR